MHLTLGFFLLTQKVYTMKYIKLFPCKAKDSKCSFFKVNGYGRKILSKYQSYGQSL